MPTLLKKLERMEVHLDEFLALLESTKNIDVHRHINQFFYMERAAEIKLLRAQMQDALCTTERIRKNMESIYLFTFAHWQKDARWLGRYRSLRSTKESALTIK